MKESPVAAAATAPSTVMPTSNGDSMAAEVAKVIAAVRPAVQADKGDIELISVGRGDRDHRSGAHGRVHQLSGIVLHAQGRCRTNHEGPGSGSHRGRQRRSGVLRRRHGGHAVANVNAVCAPRRLGRSPARRRANRDSRSVAVARESTSGQDRRRPRQPRDVVGQIAFDRTFDDVRPE